MASTKILSDNGVSSGSSGIKVDGGNDGVLILQTTTAGGTATDAVTINATQQVGIGTSSPTTGVKAEISGYIGSSFSAATNNAIVGAYSFINTRSEASANPIRAMVTGGREDSAWGAYLSFYTSTGTAAITEKMRIDTSGNVGIGTNSPNINTNGTVLHINNSTASRASAIHMTNAESGSSASDGFLVGKWSNGINYVYDYDNNPIVFGTNNAERLTVTTAGNLQFSTTSGGIIFNKSGALNNSTLNDYEEGSWTPVSGSANITVASIYSARYVKVGNLVHVSCYINVTNSTGNSGVTWNCAGLPFAMYNGTYGSAFRYYGPNTFANNCYVESGATYIIDQNGLVTSAQGIMLSATYMTN